MRTSREIALMALLLLTGLLGCGSNSRIESDETVLAPAVHAAPGAVLGALPNLPADAAVDPAVIAQRRAAAIGTLGLAGSDVFRLEQNTAQVDAQEQSCVLQPGSHQLSWAMYRFSDLLDSDTPLVVTLRALGELPEGPCYLAVSNYNSHRWDWTELAAPAPSNALPLPQAAGAISAGGNLYVVVGAWDAKPLAVGGLELRLDCPAPPPDGFSVSDGDGAQQPVHLSWVDPALSYDPDGAGQGVFAYDGVLVQRADSAAGPWSDLVQLAPGVTGYDDQDTFAAPQGEYYYRVMTLVTGAVRLAGIPLPGRIDLTTYQLEARLSISPNSGYPSILAALNGSSSIHVGGALKSVQWDFDGNGVWDKDTVTALVTSKTFASIGRYYPRMKLTMDLGGGTTKTDTVAGYVVIGDQRGPWSELGATAEHGGRTALRGPHTTPALLGSYPGAGKFGSPVLRANGDVHVPCSDGNLYELNYDFSAVTQVPLGSGSTSTPAMDRYGDDWFTVDTGIFDKQLACMWSDNTVHLYPPTLAYGNPVITRDGNFVVTSAANIVYNSLTHPITGLPSWYAWAFALPAGFTGGTPAIDSNNDIVVTADTDLYKLSSTGTLIWKKTGAPDILHDPAIAPDRTIYVSRHNWLLAYDAGGTNKWGNVLSGENVVGAPAIDADGRVYVSTDEGRVYIYTPDGWMPYAPYYDPTAVFVSPPIIDGDGRLYLLTLDGRVVSLTKKLYLVWSYSLGQTCGLSTLALGTNGTLYAGGASKVTALR